MAWVAVHEQVIGKKLREFSKSVGCSAKEALGILVSFWLWGLNNVDQNGLINSADQKDIIDIVSIGLSVGLSGEKVVECLLLHHWIDKEPDGFYIHDWPDWQSEWHKVLNRRKYDADRKRRERASKSPLDCPPENPVQPLPSSLPIVEVDVGDVFKFYQENIGPISSHQSEVIGGFIDDGLTPGLIVEAVKDSIGAENKWKYLNRILQNCVEQKVYTAAQFSANKVEHGNRNKRKDNGVGFRSAFSEEDKR